MANERKSFLLRIDPALWKDLEGWAEMEMRSVNAQMEFLLKQAVMRRRGSQAIEKPQPAPGEAKAV